jgi:hypothetical protein
VGRGDFQNIVEVRFSILYWEDKVVLEFSCFWKDKIVLIFCDIVLVERTSFVLGFGDIEGTGFFLRSEGLDKVTKQNSCVSFVMVIHI